MSNRYPTSALAEPLHKLATRTPEQPRLAFCYYWLYQLSGQEEHLEEAYRQFRLTLLALRSQLPPHGQALATEARELAWLSTRFGREKPRWPPVQGLLEDLDTLVWRGAQRLPRAGEPRTGASQLDTIRYFAERLPHVPGAFYLDAAIAQAYGQLGQKRPLQWLSSLPVAAPARGELPLGLATGLAGELVLLARIGLAAVQEQVVKEALSNGIRSLLSVRREIDFLDGQYAVFPDKVWDDWCQPVFSSRLSWSHGDLGCCLLLYKAHELLHDPELARIAELVGLNTLLRTTPATTAASTARFADGTTGLAYLYQRLFALTGQPAYQQGHRLWLARTRQLFETDPLPLSGNCSVLATLEDKLVYQNLIASPVARQWLHPLDASAT